ncbi:MAG TPA: hypothetical protein PKC15_03395 [Rhodocyclaceae bacterium]|nr:hypothetical protein [Rhodocyclaceae bacterium]
MRRTSLLLLAACAATPAAAEMDSAFVTQLSISVAKVRAHTAQGKTFLGSGVVVATDEVLTNCHVTRDASSIAVVKGALAYNVYSPRAPQRLRLPRWIPPSSPSFRSVSPRYGPTPHRARPSWVRVSWWPPTRC